MSIRKQSHFIRCNALAMFGILDLQRNLYFSPPEPTNHIYKAANKAIYLTSAMCFGVSANILSKAPEIPPATSSWLKLPASYCTSEELKHLRE